MIDKCDEIPCTTVSMIIFFAYTMIILLLEIFPKYYMHLYSLIIISFGVDVLMSSYKNKIEDTAQNIRIWLSLMLAILPSYVNMKMVKNIDRFCIFVIALIISLILPLIIYRLIVIIVLMIEPMMQTRTFIYAIVVLMFMSFIFPFIDKSK